MHRTILTGIPKNVRCIRFFGCHTIVKPHRRFDVVSYVFSHDRTCTDNVLPYVIVHTTILIIATLKVQLSFFLQAFSIFSVQLHVHPFPVPPTHPVLLHDALPYAGQLQERVVSPATRQTVTVRNEECVCVCVCVCVCERERETERERVSEREGERCVHVVLKRLQ